MDSKKQAESIEQIEQIKSIEKGETVENTGGIEQYEQFLKYIDEKCKWIQTRTKKHMMTMLVNELQDCTTKEHIITVVDKETVINLNKLAEYNPKLVMNIYNLVRQDINKLNEPEK